MSSLTKMENLIDLGQMLLRLWRIIKNLTTLYISSKNLKVNLLKTSFLPTINISRSYYFKKNIMKILLK